jgi:transcription elongation GreA/GreB family factor
MSHAGEFDVNEQQDDSRSALPTNSEDEQHEVGLRQKNSNANAAEASLQARQRRRIAQLEEKLQVLESGRTVKEK